MIWHVNMDTPDIGKRLDRECRALLDNTSDLTCDEIAELLAEASLEIKRLREALNSNDLA